MTLEKVLIIEDDRLARDMLKDSLRDYSFQPVCLSSATGYLNAKTEDLNKPDDRKQTKDIEAAVIDLNLKFNTNGGFKMESGFSLFHTLMEDNIPLIVYSGALLETDPAYCDGKVTKGQHAISQGAFHAWTKEVPCDKVARVIREVILPAKERTLRIPLPMLGIHMYNALNAYKNTPTEDNRMNFLASFYRALFEDAHRLSGSMIFQSTSLNYYLGRYADAFFSKAPSQSWTPTLL